MTETIKPSDTPRTDGMEPWDLKYRNGGEDYEKVPADFARQLERELAEARRGEPVAWMWEHVANKTGEVLRHGLSFQRVEGTDDALWDGTTSTRSTPLYTSPSSGVVVPRDKLEHWLEYWNGARNDRAMADALDFILGEIKYALAAAESAPGQEVKLNGGAPEKEVPSSTLGVPAPAADLIPGLERAAEIGDEMSE